MKVLIVFSSHAGTDANFWQYVTGFNGPRNLNGDGNLYVFDGRDYYYNGGWTFSALRDKIREIIDTENGGNEYAVLFHTQLDAELQELITECSGINVSIFKNFSGAVDFFSDYIQPLERDLQKYFSLLWDELQREKPTTGNLEALSLEPAGDFAYKQDGDMYEDIKRKIAEKSAGDSILLYSYKDETHFKELWKFDSSLSKRIIVIVWDGIPKGTPGSLVDTSKYLTPIDWAVGYSLSIKDEIGSSSSPDLKILIIDVASHLVPRSDSLKFVYQHCNKQIVSMPWVRIISDIEAFSTTLDNLGSGVSLPSSQDEGCDLDSVKGIWAAGITRPSTPGDHHALANLVGPLLLTDEEGGDLHVDALQVLMRNIGLLPDCKKKDSLKENDENAKALLNGKNSWIDWENSEWSYKSNELLINSSDKLKLILIDDMFQISWGKILCQAVGVNYKTPSEGEGKNKLVEISEYNTSEGGDETIVIKAASSAEWILEKLEGLGEKKDNRFGFSLDDEIAGQEILFLDLRLYTSPGNFLNEKDFFKRLTNLAGNPFFKVTNNNLPWPGITNDEIAEIQGWINNSDRQQEDPEYIKALTLLPRILALTDLSLPIVLFSSTGRRDITEKLKPYGNIITVFEKPRFTVDIPLDIALQTKRKFQDVMEIAHMILQARQKCRTIIATGSEANNGVDGLGDKKYHIELFIDECYVENSVELDNLLPESDLATQNELIWYSVSNKRLIFKKQRQMSVDEKQMLLALSTNGAYQSAVNKLYKESSKQNEAYVGGLFAIFEDAQNIDAARKKADKFDDDLVNNNVRYFDSLGVGAQRSEKGIRNKGVSSANDLFKTMNESRNKPGYLGFIGLRHLLPNTPGFDLLNPRSADNLFRLTLTALIELFLFETLPTLFDSTSDNVSVSVYAGTRVKRYANNDYAQKELNKAMFHFGSTSFSTGYEYFLRSINRDSICPMISDIISFHNVKRKIYRAVGIQLPYKKGKTSVPEYFVCRECKKVVSVSKRDINRSGKEASLNIELKCQCKDTGIFSPDYRALHYIADEILNHIEDIYSGNNYGKSIKKVLGGFDDVLNEDLKSVIKASRYLDIEETVSAIAEVKVTKDYKPNDHSIKPLLLRRIASKLDNLKGEEFIKLGKMKNEMKRGFKEISEDIDTIKTDKKKNERLEGIIVALRYSVIVESDGSSCTAQLNSSMKVTVGESVYAIYVGKDLVIYSDQERAATSANRLDVVIKSLPEIKEGVIKYKKERYSFDIHCISEENHNKLCNNSKVSFIKAKNKKAINVEVL